MDLAGTTTAAVLCCLLVFIVTQPDTVSSCTSGFMQLDILRKNAELINNDIELTERLDTEFRLFPSMNFACSGTITGVLLSADIMSTDKEAIYPEIQLWRNIVGTDQFIRQTSQEIRLNPGSFSPDGVLQYSLNPPMSFQSGDVLGVYQPQRDESVVRLFYTRNNSASDSYQLPTDNSPQTIALQQSIRKTNQLLLLSPITDAGHCATGFLGPSKLREMTAGLNFHDVVTMEKEQRLFPDITFTCNGSITKWIVGAGDVSRDKRDFSQIQLWRRGASNEYNRVGRSLLIINETSHTNVHEYYPNPPLEFQEGDILGVYQPDDGVNVLQLYYQENTGPLNYLKSSINPPPPSLFTQTAPATQVYYPLVSAVISTSVNYQELVDVAITSSTVTILTTGGLSNLMSSPCVTPTPSQEYMYSSTAVMNLTPSSTQFETPASLDIRIIIAASVAAVVTLVGVTLALLIAVLLSKSCHRRSCKSGVSVENPVRDHETMSDQTQDYSQLFTQSIASTIPTIRAESDIVYEIPVQQNLCYVAPFVRNQIAPEQPYVAVPLSRPSSMVPNNAYNMHQLSNFNLNRL